MLWIKLAPANPMKNRCFPVYSFLLQILFICTRVLSIFARKAPILPTEQKRQVDSSTCLFYYSSNKFSGNSSKCSNVLRLYAVFTPSSFATLKIIRYHSPSKLFLSHFVKPYVIICNICLTFLFFYVTLIRS